MILSPEETNLTGSWSFDGKRVIGDHVCCRIKFLTTQYLKKITSSPNGWDILYQDPNDARYWELIFPNSQMQGGGPPSLINLSAEAAKNKYQL